jgi:molybdopterin-guanine dinucleotide biosynthesis protein A
MISAVLFVGGESRRMGRDKATLLYEGEPLWQRQLRTLRAIAPEEILISARTKPEWCPPDVEVILDTPPSRGPLSGLAAALGKIRTPHLLALAVDMPLMTPEHLRWLQTHIGPGCGVVPVRSGHCEPLCAIYPAEVLDAARAAMTSDDVSLHAFIATLRNQQLMTDCSLTETMLTFYINANSPGDLG